MIFVRSSFRIDDPLVVRYERTWTIDQIVGCYSTSYCSLAVLGEKKEAFETDLRRSLQALNPARIFHEVVELTAFVLCKD